jgi:hypothetical protein
LFDLSELFIDSFRAVVTFKAAFSDNSLGAGIEGADSLTHLQREHLIVQGAVTRSANSLPQLPHLTLSRVERLCSGLVCSP